MQIISIIPANFKNSVWYCLFYLMHKSNEMDGMKKPCFSVVMVSKH